MRRLPPALKIVITAATVIIVPIVSYVVFVHFYTEWAIRQYPHDGMIGLSAMFDGAIWSVVVTVITCLVLVRVLREPHSS